MTIEPILPHEKPLWIWLSSLGLALLMAFSSNPVATSLLMAGERLGWTARFMPDGVSMNHILAVQILVMVAAFPWLLRIKSHKRRFGKGLIAAGILFMLSIPVMMLLAMIENARDVGIDHGGAAAAFFMVLIFGGFYFMLGMGLLIGGIVILRRRSS